MKVKNKKVKGLFLHLAILFISTHIHINIKFTKQDTKIICEL